MGINPHRPFQALRTETAASRNWGLESPIHVKIDDSTHLKTRRSKQTRILLEECLTLEPNTPNQFLGISFRESLRESFHQTEGGLAQYLINVCAEFGDCRKRFLHI